MFKTHQLLELARFLSMEWIFFLHQSMKENVIDECGLAASRNTGNYNQLVERKCHVYIFKIVLAGSEQLNELRLFLNKGGVDSFFDPDNLFLDKYCPVRESGLALSSANVPLATILPPKEPAPGPKS